MCKKEIKTESMLVRIERLRGELVKSGLRDGLTAHSTVKQSELLDEEIKVYQQMLR